MKISVLCFLLIVINCFGQENYTVTTSKINEAKIYFSGGILKKSFSADVLPGKNFIIIKEFGRNSGIDISTFKTDKKVNVLRVESYSENSYLYADKIEKDFDRNIITDSIDYYKKVGKKFDQELALVKNSIGIIQKNQTLGNPSSTEILKMIEFNQTTLRNLYNEESLLTNKISINYNKVSVWENKKNRTSGSEETSKIIILHVRSDKKQRVNFEINQYLQEANWRPYYIIRSNGIKSPLKISYKAKIQQNSGNELKNIPIKLINGSFSAEDKPYELDRWFLRTDKDGNVSNQAFRSPYERSNSNVAEYAVMERPKVSQKAIKTEISLDKSTVIPSNVEITEDIDQFEVMTTYKYFTTPKLENKTYLLAYIKDYSKYNLLPGNADIVIEDTQVGTVTIDPNQLTSEMLISLGSDPNVLTKRELVKKETKNIGNKQKQESYFYEITIKNNKDSAINLELKDQIPLASDEKVKIELVNSDQAKYEASTGFLVWNIDIKANETRTIKFGFNVTLPEDLITIDIK
ncbi:DUF4139 domain-containing protein [Chryseobacterium sp. PBS4-4]|uniref:DUF4139 domain-containing protein n=1 Tax=Chryseobacterium edaphi TaxID=2976532 RepID=A0ABT2W6G7_9FLAO|nr:DUF4139 domain-containing protein [Chryseobacterium edaphi]MCU7617534.1 DUF4139 domain-containing protein [Chryseobacterium edaphi]